MIFPVLAFLDVGGPELLLIMFAILVLFGGERLPSLARGLGRSIREFKRASAGVEEEIKRAIESAPEPKPKVQPAPAPQTVAAAQTAPSPASVPEPSAAPSADAAGPVASSPEPEAQLEPESMPNTPPALRSGPQG